MNVMEHIVITKLFFPLYVTDSNGLAGHVQSWESEEQPVDLVWPLHHIHCRLPFSRSSGCDEVRVHCMLHAKPVFCFFLFFTVCVNTYFFPSNMQAWLLPHNLRTMKPKVSSSWLAGFNFILLNILILSDGRESYRWPSFLFPFQERSKYFQAVIGILWQCSYSFLSYFDIWSSCVLGLQLPICVAICTHWEAWCPSSTADIPKAPWSWSWATGWTTAGTKNRNNYKLFMGFFLCYYLVFVPLK